MGDHYPRIWKSVIAYSLLMLERLSDIKKTVLDYKRLPYPKPSARAVQKLLT